MKYPWEKPLEELFPHPKSKSRPQTPPKTYKPGTITEPSRYPENTADWEARKSRQKLHDDFVARHSRKTKKDSTPK